MTTTNPSTPAAFTNDDFAGRMSRVASSAAEKGLAGVIVTPGPDLVWLTGYRPTAITERLTMLVLSPDKEPTLLVPVLERPDAEAAEGAGSVSLVDWEDGTDPYEVAGPLLRPDGEFGISDSAWAMHLLAHRSIMHGLRSVTAIRV
jgi:Xaa-Pro aminopeptidase